MSEISIEQKSARNQFFAFNQNTVRVFNCNEVFFQNITEQVILINDVYRLMPNQFIYIRSQPREIDRTIYKLTIPDGGICQGYFKMDEGVTNEIQNESIEIAKTPRPNRMRTKGRESYIDKTRK